MKCNEVIHRPNLCFRQFVRHHVFLGLLDVFPVLLGFGLRDRREQHCAMVYDGPFQSLKGALYTLAYGPMRDLWDICRGGIDAVFLFRCLCWGEDPCDVTVWAFDVVNELALET